MYLKTFNTQHNAIMWTLVASFFLNSFCILVFLWTTHFNLSCWPLLFSLWVIFNKCLPTKCNGEDVNDGCPSCISLTPFLSYSMRPNLNCKWLWKTFSLFCFVLRAKVSLCRAVWPSPCLGTPAGLELMTVLLPPSRVCAMTHRFVNDFLNPFTLNKWVPYFLVQKLH